MTRCHTAEKLNSTSLTNRCRVIILVLKSFVFELTSSCS